MRVYVVGGGGHAKVVVATLMELGIRPTAVLDDDADKWGSNILGLPVVGPTSLLGEEAAPGAVLAVGDNRLRKALFERYPGVSWLTVVHPRAYVHPSASLGEGTVVFAGAVVQALAVVGRQVIVNTGAIVEHDCFVGEFAHLAPGVRLAGAVRIGEGCLVGVGASLAPGVRVGDWSVVGAGSVVVRDIPRVRWPLAFRPG